VLDGGGGSGKREGEGDDVDDEYKIVWPRGLWATSQGSEASKAYNRILGS
jgi:hypothetical protein